MYLNFKKIFNKKKNLENENSIAVSNKIVNKFISNPDFPYIISFPRTGSHWLRMVMELYFEEPSLVRIFYSQFKNANDFTCYHRHDTELNEERKNVIYLYRHPVPTIYSQLKYYKEDIFKDERIIYWSELYGRHLSKWLLTENFTQKKTILTYENMQNDIYPEFKKVCDHFGVEFNKAKLDKILHLVNKENLKKKTKHDKQVVNINQSYDKLRKDFIEKKSELVMDIIFKQNNELNKFFNKY